MSAIPLVLSKDVDRTRDEFPEVLASYAPVENGEIRWVPDVESGEEIARASGRPVLLFGMFPTCPWCMQMKAEGLRDPAVVAMMEEFVPVQVNLYELSEEDRAALMDRGYPLFEVQDASGEVLHAFPGFHDAPSFVENLSTGADKFGREKDAPKWEDVQRLAREYDQALKAEDAGQLGVAEHKFATLDRESPATDIARAARHGLERIAADARATLLAARAVAQHDARGAERDLADAARRFEGSSYFADLDAARERLARDGRFPALASGE